MKKISEWTRLAAGVIVIACIAACGTVPSSLPTAAQKSDETVFPDLKSAWQKEGTFVNVDNLRNVRLGMSKDQLYDLLGRPHFSEGLVGVREWDYIFNFHKGAEVVVCQFKTKFDENYKASSFHWLPSGCAQLIQPPVPVPVARAAAPTLVTLSADALFAFDKSGLQDLQPKGRRELDELAAKVSQTGHVKRIDVVGYTDNLGSESYNRRLSEARANTVGNYLAGKGVPANRITAKGMGAAKPMVECPDGGSRAAQINCLAPNRRVELAIEVLQGK
jgi:OmpA-OmpF porin, OOP family